jgi:hypothetical protein
MKNPGGPLGLRPPSRPLRVPSFGPADAAAPTAATKNFVKKFRDRHQIYCQQSARHFVSRYIRAMLEFVHKKIFMRNDFCDEMTLFQVLAEGHMQCNEIRYKECFRPIFYFPIFAIIAKGVDL